jgi:hypothetical protein
MVRTSLRFGLWFIVIFLLGSGVAEAKTNVPTSRTACYYFAPQPKSADVCAKGVIDGKDPGLCIAGGTTLSRFYKDPTCKNEAKVTACWTLTVTKDLGTEHCEAGEVIESDGVLRCRVGTAAGEMDFFFDNQCNFGNLGWSAEKSGKIPEMMKSIRKQKIMLPTPADETDCPPGHPIDSRTGLCSGSFHSGKSTQTGI